MSSDDARPLVLHVVHRFDTGGLENGIVNLINHMPQRAYRHAVLAAIALFGPNSNWLGERVLESVAHAGHRRPLIGGAVALGACVLVVLNAARDNASAFIYFNF